MADWPEAGNVIFGFSPWSLDTWANVPSGDLSLTRQRFDWGVLLSLGDAGATAEAGD